MYGKVGLSPQEKFVVVRAFILSFGNTGESVEIQLRVEGSEAGHGEEFCSQSYYIHLPGECPICSVWRIKNEVHLQTVDWCFFVRCGTGVGNKERERVNMSI